MTFIATNFDDAVESRPAPNGRYNLQITACQVTKSGERSKRPGSPQYKVTIGFTDDPHINNLTHFISLPHEDDEPDSGRYKTLLLKRFLEAFKVPYDKGGFDLEGLAMQMVGAQANLEVRQDEPTDSGDIYNRLVVPKLPSEAGRGAPPSRGRGR